MMIKPPNFRIADMCYFCGSFNVINKKGVREYRCGKYHLHVKADDICDEYSRRGNNDYTDTSN
jgi:hypothetical protein